MRPSPPALPLRSEVLKVLSQNLQDRNLYELAETFGVTLHKQGRVNKGWVGQTIERAAQLPINNLQARDGADFELKSTSLVHRDGAWIPKETIKITQLNPKLILEETFETSALWSKLSRWILVGCDHPSVSMCRVVFVGSFDLDAPEIVAPIRQFWEELRELVCSGDLVDYFNVGTSEDLIQLRPTGDGKQWSTCPITGEKFPARAFYATKRLIRFALLSTRD